MEDDVVVTGMALRSPSGNNIDAVWDNLLCNKSSLEYHSFLENEKFRFNKACLCNNYNSSNPSLRGKEMVASCVEELISESKIALPSNTGIFIGSTLGEGSLLESAAVNNNTDYSRCYAGHWADYLKNRYHLNGLAVAFGNACAAGNYAIGQAAAYMQHYGIDVAIAGAAEPFSKIAMAGFSRSRAMSNDYCKPFDANRNGMVLGEGAAFFILEKKSHAKKRNAKMYCKITALGLSCDAYHATAPLPDGSGMQKAMQHAIKEANLQATEIDFVCAHGSGTVASDAAELSALQNVFGSNTIPVSGYKGALGHSLGAAAALELAICIKAMENNYIPRSTNFTSLPNEFEVNICTENISLQLTHIMNCAYAFGGINSALIISKT